MSFVNKENITSIIQGSNGVKDALNQKANTDGYYETLTAGTSEQLLSTVSINDKVPYNFRTSGGSADIGNRLTDKIVGGTICWNQLFGDHNGKTPFPAVEEEFTNGVRISAVDKSSGSITIEVDNTIRESTVVKRFFYGSSFPIPNFQNNTTNRFLIIGCPKTEGSVLAMGLSFGSGASQRLYETGNGVVMNYNSGGYYFSAYVTPNCPAGTYVFYPQIIDLTKMFGKTIAEYLYSRDISSKGNGKAWFRELFPKDYYAYNSGTMMSVNAASHDTVGFNAYDNTTGKAKLVGSMEYQITGAYTALAYSTGETITPDEDGYFTPTASGELTVTGGNATTTCVHLVWDGERDGEFEEYIKHSYPLDSSLVLQGVPMLDANNKLYYDGDIYESDGTVTRRYGIVDLGTLQWTYLDSGEGSPCFYNTGELPGVKGGLRRMICSKYPCIYDWRRNLYDKSVSSYNNTGSQKVAIRDTDYTTASVFKTAMSGVYLVYELATPTTESADPFINPQIVDDFGTEEYIDYAYSQGNRDVAIPVGHDTDYYPNLRAKLEMAPESPDGDGDYIVRQSGGENTYVPLTKELPAAPSEDGNYVLKVTVVNGAPTYSWEAQA